MARHDIFLSKEFQMRVVSAAVLAPLVLLIVAVGGFFFQALVAVGMVLMIIEWEGLINSKEAKITGEKHKKWRWAGVAYVSLLGFSLFYLRGRIDGFPLLMLLLATVWATDIAAYFSGRLIGGVKLAPTISPGKTWAGLIGGMLAAAMVGMFFSVFLNLGGTFTLGIIGALLAVVSQGGDLLESWVKRQCSAKDSGNLIPGHGGLMDRVDGLVTAAPLLVILAWLHDMGLF